MIQRERAERPTPAQAAPEPPPVPPGATMVYRPPQQAVAGGAEPAETVAERVTLTVDGQLHEVDTRNVVIGRSKECEIQLGDPNVSRRHAELRQEGTAYWIVDLGSTNGTEVNGKRLDRAKLEHGDTITIGSTELLFERGFPDPGKA